MTQPDPTLDKPKTVEDILEEFFPLGYITAAKAELNAHYAQLFLDIVNQGYPIVLSDRDIPPFGDMGDEMVKHWDILRQHLRNKIKQTLNQETGGVK